jgi:hypothetical protein
LWGLVEKAVDGGEEESAASPVACTMVAGESCITGRRQADQAMEVPSDYETAGTHDITAGEIRWTEACPELRIELWRGGRVVECSRLENGRGESLREFESPPLRHRSPN